MECNCGAIYTRCPDSHYVWCESLKPSIDTSQFIYAIQGNMAPIIHGEVVYEDDLRFTTNPEEAAKYNIDWIESMQINYKMDYSYLVNLPVILGVKCSSIQYRITCPQFESEYINLCKMAGLINEK